MYYKGNKQRIRLRGESGNREGREDPLEEKAIERRPLRGNMTEGNVTKVLLLFTIPTFLTNFLNALYNTADSIVIGQFAGAGALAAVGANAFLTNMLVAVFSGAGAGGGIYIAQLVGARKQDELSGAFGCMYSLIALMAAVTGVIGSLAAVPLMKALNTPADIMADTVAYFRIFCVGLPALGIYNAGTSGLRSLGDAKAPLYFLIFSAVLNVALNLLFVVVFRMGVPGVAWATVISEYLSAVLVLFRTSSTKFAKIVISAQSLRLRRETVGLILKLGIPSSIQMGLFSIGNVLCQRYMNGFGSNAIAATSAAVRLDAFIVMPAMAISIAMSVFVGQNLAAKKEERLKQGKRIGMGLCVGMSVLFSLILYIFAEEGIRLFTPEPEVVRYGAQMLRTMSFFYWTIGVYNAYAGILRGAGDTVTVMLITMVGTITRVPLTYFMSARTGIYINYFLAFVISNSLMMILAAVRYYQGDWKKKVVVTVDE